MNNKLLFTSLLLTSLHAQAQPAAPVLQVNTEGSELHLHWAEVDSAAGYRLFYAPYPYLGEATIDSIDLGTEKDFAIDLWQGAAFYVALQSYDGQNQHSTYSNVGFFQIQDRGDSYRQYWRTVTKEISEQSFTSNEFLYDLMPNIADCFAGTLNQQAQFRQLDAFNQVRQLHQLSDISYDSFADSEVQQASLIQRANNFLSHTPPMGSNCYSAEGFDGSKSSNLHLSTHNSDPAGDIISYIDDASNVSNIAGVGHRRALLNPFLKFTSYGQVLGGSAVKVSDFSDSSTTDTEDIPDFIAFPYMRYPYVFFSDKTLNKKTPWSLAIVEDKDSIWGNQHNYFARAKLTVIQKDNDQQMAVADIHSDTKGFGVPNNLSWTVTDWQYDTWYSVIISDINYQSSVTDSIQYDVYIDYQNIIDINFALETDDQQDGTVMRGTLFEKDDKDSFTLDLEGSITFSGSSQFSNMAFYIAVYGPDKQLILAKDSAFTLDLAAGQYTLVISNCHVQTCYLDQKNYTVRVN